MCRVPEREPCCDATGEADHQPGWQLGALRLQEALHRLHLRENALLPIDPSPLWKRRTRYVRGAHPLHCNIERIGKRA
jgi:hypothetical protein